MTDPGPTIVARSAAPAPDAAAPPSEVTPSPARLVQGPFDDPKVYQDYVRALFDTIAPRISSASPQVSAEIAILARLLTLMPPAAVESKREYFELAFELLQAEQPNLIVVRSIHRDLFQTADRYMGGISRLLLFLSGRSLLNAILSALLTIFLMSFVFMALMHAGAHLLFMVAGRMGGSSATLGAVPGVSFNIAMLMAHAAFLGSIVSIMARMKTFIGDQDLTPSMMYLSVVTRPVVSVLVAMLAFCCIQSGLVSFRAVELNGASGYYTAWAIGFLCGFSERLAQNFVASATQQFAGAAAAPAGPKS